MRILIAPDSFKESLTAAQAAACIAEGIRKVLPDAEITQLPLSDGGEGLTETLVTPMNGRMLAQEVTAAMGNRVTACYGIAGAQTAILEMAAASGLALVPPAQRNPLQATTYGTGELIRAALDQGCRRLIIGIGGSATNDGGAGMARALGVRMMNTQGNDIAEGPAGLLELEAIDMAAIDARLAHTEIKVACDVTNPLCGPQGASRVYGPQKGADAAAVELMDRALARMAEVIKRDLGLAIADLPGAGAAGGLGAGLAAFAGATLQPGLDLVLEILQFDALLAAGQDLIITGEGEINGQSLYGKVPVGVARRAREQGIPVLALVGNIGPNAEQVYAEGMTSIMSIAPGPITREQSMARAGELLTNAAERAIRLIERK
ncbi:MAG TPA: glycerate kinase [Syntrophomonas sp.]|nr:glycerate kinase [Syntrophomonas sp.]